MTKKVLMALVLGGCALSVFSSNAMQGSLNAMFKACSGCLSCRAACAAQGPAAFNECMGICGTQGGYDPSIIEQTDPACIGMCAVCVIGAVVLTQKECFGDCAAKMGQIFCLTPRTRAQVSVAAVVMPKKNQ